MFYWEALKVTNLETHSNKTTMPGHVSIRFTNQVQVHERLEVLMKFPNIIWSHIRTLDNSKQGHLFFCWSNQCFIILVMWYNRHVQTHVSQGKKNKKTSIVPLCFSEREIFTYIYHKTRPNVVKFLHSAGFLEREDLLSNQNFPHWKCLDPPDDQALAAASTTLTSKSVENWLDKTCPFWLLGGPLENHTWVLSRSLY